MKKLFTILIFLYWVSTAFAVPAPPKPFNVDQPDGSSLTVQAHGDEFGLFFESTDGYTITKDTAGWWRYAVRGADGKLKPSQLEPGKGDPKTLGISQHERHDAKVMQEIDKARREANNSRKISPKLKERKKTLEKSKSGTKSDSNGVDEQSPVTGYTQAPDAASAGVTANATAQGVVQAVAPTTYRLAVLLIEFPTDATNAAVPHTYTQTQVEQFIFSNHTYTSTPLGNPAYGSMRDYYDTVSFGQFNLTGQVFPWVMADQGKSNYEADYYTLRNEAIAKSGVDLSQFDGYAVIYAGQAGSGTLWPHSFLGMNYMSSEIFGPVVGDLTDVGVNCHEFGHVLGLPDLYYGEGNIGPWSLMAAGNYGGDYNSGYRPVQLLAVEKEVMGWITPALVSTGSHPNLSLPPVGDTGIAYKAVSESSYFYLENRQKSGYDLMLPGHGLTVWHYDPGQQQWTTGATYKLDMEEADGIQISWGSGDGAPFPGATSNTSFNCSSVPSSKDNNGTCSVSFSNIAETAGIISLDANVGMTPGVGITIDGVGNFPTIFTALAFSNPGQTVRVPPGLFTEMIVLPSGVNLTGAGAGRTILQHTANGSSSLVKGEDNSSFSGFTLKGADYLNSDTGLFGIGYDVADVTTSPISISNCAFIGFQMALNLSTYNNMNLPLSNLKVSNNIFSKNTYGLFVGSLNPTIENNIFVANGYGIYRYIRPETMPVIDYNNFYGNFWANIEIYSGQTGLNTVFTDPMLTDVVNEDYRLLPGSPDINSGNPAILDLDGSRSDIGVYGGPLALPLPQLTIVTSTLPETVSGRGYSQKLESTGGRAPFTWSVTGGAGSLPQGLTLDSATGVISGTPAAAGNSRFNVQIVDADNLTDSKVLTLTIFAPAVVKLNNWTDIFSGILNSPSDSGLSLGGFAVGSGLNRLLMVAVVIETGSVASPTITPAYGGVELTPLKVTSNQRETVWVGYLKENQIGNGVKDINLTYSGATTNSAYHLKWAAFANVDQNAPFAGFGGTSTATTSATFGSVINYVNGGITTVVAGNGGTPATGTLAATPAFTAGTATTSDAQTSRTFTSAQHTANGSYAATTAVTWSGTTSARSATVAASLQQARPNNPPAFSTAAITKPNATFGRAYSGQTLAGSASDPDGDIVSYGKVSGPTWLSVATDGTLSGTPAASDTGANSFIVSATSNGRSATATLTITVVANQPPIFIPNPVTKPNSTVGIAYSGQTLAGSASDPEGDSISYSKISGPAWLTIDAAGTLGGTPSLSDLGSNTSTVRATSTGGTADATLAITVVAAPLAVTQLNAWANLYSASPNNTTGTNLTAGSLTVGSGANRLLLVAVVMEIGSNANPVISAAYGGVTLTPLKATTNTQREIVWIGYLKESQIGTGSKALTVSYSGATGNVSALHVKWAAFANVNQANPAAGIGGVNTATTSATFGSTVNYVADGMTTVIAGNGGTPATGTLSATPAFTAGTATTTNAQTSRTFTTAKHTANGSYAASTAVKWSGTTSTRSATVVVSLQP